MSQSVVEHEELERQLERADLAVSCAEVHGLLCGLLCSSAEDAAETWLAELLPEESEGDLLLRECRRTLQRLYDQTRASIGDPGMGFALLLPNDEAPIRRRAGAVRDWCSGFLYGLGLAGSAVEPLLAASTRESLSDIGEITRMNIDALDENDEAEEEALMQVSEFLRVAAMLVYDDLAGRRKGDDQH